MILHLAACKVGNYTCGENLLSAVLASCAGVARQPWNKDFENKKKLEGRKISINKQINNSGSLALPHSALYRSRETFLIYSAKGPMPFLCRAQK